jgi:general secretion pathway protein G
MKRSSPFKVRSSRLKVKDALFHPSSLIPHPCRAGFTLIEILVVIVIIMILAGIVIAAAKYALTKAARSRAQSEIASMEAALENFKSDNGAYPVSTPVRTSPIPPGISGQPEIDNSVKLYAALAGGTKQYFPFKPNQLGTDPVSLKPYIIDPFGHPYNYFCQVPPPINQASKATFDLWSYGPDGMIGLILGVDHDADNITNWKQ